MNRIDDVKVGSVGKLLPGNSMRLSDDDELLVKGGVVFNGYWHNEEETKAVFSDGWFHTGDLGAIDDDGFLTIIGRKKEIIVTAGGKNVAPAILEDRLRAHPLISQAMAVGDAKPFIAALITIDPEAFPGWKQRNSKDANATVGDLATDPDLMAEVELAVKDANQAVSKAEAIRKFRILPVDFTEDTGELTPTLKVKRKVVAEKFASDIEALYDKDAEPPAGPPSRFALVLHCQLSTTHRRPAWPIRAARSGSASRSLTDAAIAPTSQPSTTTPVSPSRTVSGAPPERPATTGTPVAEASR